ncbi:MAG: 3-oxoacyl-ACP reductase FabG [Dehalococcoidia bacterium]|jgi:3-oxoacyl-[acyl-carrier protein] reductase|nr:3-oxoacyl-ACP reductase FabG [Dehalococcoidia bacterium]
MYDFKGQTAIVTGGTRGIGRSIVEGFLRAGARVIIASNEAATEQFKQDNSDFIADIDIQMCDVAKYEEVEKFFNYVDTKYEGFEILVNNAGIRKDAVLAMMKESDWHDVLDVNLSGVFYMCKFAVMSLMRKRYGRIISITSPSGKYGFEGQANYAASKAGLVALTRSLSKEVARRGITVNCVSPGFIATELIQDLPQELRDTYVSQVPLKRFGKPEEVAACVLFLASKEASYVSGSTLEVTGGL